MAQQVEMIVVLESSGLSAVLVDNRWLVGRRCRGEMTMPRLREYDIDLEASSIYLPPPKPKVYIEMEVLATSPILEEAMNSALRIIQQETL